MGNSGTRNGGGETAIVGSHDEFTNRIIIIDQHENQTPTGIPMVPQCRNQSSETI